MPPDRELFKALDILKTNRQERRIRRLTQEEIDPGDPGPEVRTASPPAILFGGLYWTKTLVFDLVVRVEDCSRVFMWVMNVHAGSCGFTRNHEGSRVNTNAVWFVFGNHRGNMRVHRGLTLGAPEF